MHRHACGQGHYWDCEGSAVRNYDSQSTECICFDHGVPMEVGDHSECTIELLTCPLHRKALTEACSVQSNEPQIEGDWVPIKAPENWEEMFYAWINDPEPSIGWCLLCNSVIRTENDLIPNSNAHICEAGGELETEIAALPQSSEHSDRGAADVKQTGTTLHEGLTDPQS